MGCIFPFLLSNFCLVGLPFRDFFKLFHRRVCHCCFATLFRLLDGQKCVRKNTGMHINLSKHSHLFIAFCVKRRLVYAGGITSMKKVSLNGTLNLVMELLHLTRWRPTLEDRLTQDCFGLG